MKNESLIEEIDLFLYESKQWKHINENIFNDIKRKYRSMTNTSHQLYNKRLIQKVADLFDEPYAKFLEKQLYVIFKNEFLEEVIDNAKNGDKGSINRLKSILLHSMITFYEKAIMSKFFKKSLSGDKRIDEAFRRSINNLFQTDTIIDIFYDNIDKVLPVSIDDLTKLIEANGNRSNKIKNTYRYIKHLGDPVAMAKYKITDKLLSYIPKVDRKLKIKIKEAIFNMDTKTIKKLGYKWNINRIIDALSEPIINYIHNKVKNKYLNNSNWRFFNSIVEDIISSDEMEKMFKTEFKNIMSLEKLAKTV